jgi:methionyl-tRNA formyltransferase
MTRILFMGTPQFAVPSLEQLIEHYDVVAVVTQPDAPAGRGNHLAQRPVKQVALSKGLPVLQPESLKPAEVVEQLRSYQPDCIVVAAFGQILRKPVLDLPRYGCINVHGSLLPRWRGASPVSAAIAAGDEATGITIMRMDVGLDNGPLLSKRAEPIGPQDTTATLMERLSHIGADLLIDTLPKYFAGQINPEVQDESLVTLCRQLKKEQGRIDWGRSAVEVERHVRAMIPWPGAFTLLDGKQLKILKSRVGMQLDRMLRPPGQLFLQRGKELLVACNGGALELLEVQLEGKKATAAADFARGHAALLGTLVQ